jgi:hypothetical protein
MAAITSITPVDEQELEQGRPSFGSFESFDSFGSREFVRWSPTDAVHSTFSGKKESARSERFERPNDPNAWLTAWCALHGRQQR